ncbi:MAG: FtsQ-type POTRA domain-containing protein [Puniceicoccales bacterium]|nr:FtsQ-type POTRA domain-containing protein [Puniceicoccales bacterium]
MSGKWKIFLVAAAVALAIIFRLRTGSPRAWLPYSGALTRVTFSTNGRISPQWISEELHIRGGVNLLSVDIESMRMHLEKFQQIRRVAIEKRYPCELSIKLEERLPILKIAANVGGEKKLLLVDGIDGEIFSPICYSREDVSRIPFAIFPIAESADKSKFTPLRGVDIVRDFIVTLRSDFPDIFSGVRFIDLENYDSRPGALWSTIKFHMKNGIVVVFGTQNFTLQLLRLDYLLQEKCAANLHRVKEINLSSSANAVVEYK